MSDRKIPKTCCWDSALKYPPPDHRDQFARDLADGVQIGTVVLKY